MKKKLLLIISFQLTFIHITNGQACNFSIRGKVLHEENNEPILSAHIWIPELEIGATSDWNGNFRFNGLCSDNLTLIVSYLGHKQYTESIILKGNLNLTIRLVADHIELEQIEIHGHQEAILTTTSVSSIKKRRFGFEKR